MEHDVWDLEVNLDCRIAFKREARVPGFRLHIMEYGILRVDTKVE